MTRPVFTWDAATDTIKRAPGDTDFEKMLREYTAISKEQLDSIIANRKKFIENNFSSFPSIFAFFIAC